MSSLYSQPLWMDQASKLVCIVHTPPLLLHSSLVTTYLLYNAVHFLQISNLSIHNFFDNFTLYNIVLASIHAISISVDFFWHKKQRWSRPYCISVKSSVVMSIHFSKTLQSKGTIFESLGFFSEIFSSMSLLIFIFRFI